MSGCNTAVESLFILVEKVLYGIASNVPSRIKDTGHMLDIIGKINNSNLPTNSIRVGFNIVNMFPSIDSKSGLKSVHDFYVTVNYVTVNYVTVNFHLSIVL